MVNATFPSFGSEGPSQDCPELFDDIDELACYWRAITHALVEAETSDHITDELLKDVSKASHPQRFSMCLLTLD